jgi:hypothetical protein
LDPCGRNLDGAGLIPAAHGAPNGAKPTTTARFERTPREGGGTRVTIMSTFPSIAQMAQFVAMGKAEGLWTAMGQMNALLVA